MIKSAALLKGTALLDGKTPDACVLEPSNPEQTTHPLDWWAHYVVTLSIATAHGRIAKADAVDQLQALAERDGLIEAFGQDAIQEAMAHAFEAVWAPPSEARDVA